MAERIVSPGVFTSEIDQSFLPAAISNLGAALIGTCTKGPAFVPTVVNSFTDFNLRFGNLSPYHYLPYTAQSYLKNATSATVVRVLGDSGYTATKPILIKTVGTAATGSTGSIAFGSASRDGGTAVDGDFLMVTGSSGTTYRFIVDTAPLSPNTSTDFYVLGVGIHPTASFMDGLMGAINTSSLAASEIGTFSQDASLPHVLIWSSSTDYGAGTSIGFNTGSLNATPGLALSSSNIADVIGDGLEGPGGGTNAAGVGVLAAVFPTGSGADASLASSVLVATDGNASPTIQQFAIKWTNTDYSPTMSLVSSDSNYICSVLGEGAQSSAPHQGYVYKIWKSKCNNSTATDVITGTEDTNTAFGGYSDAQTPVVQSQTGSTSTDVTDLFQFQTISSGEAANREIKVAISNIKKPGSIAGTDYGTFDVLVRRFDDTDKRQTVLETFAGVNLDESSANYIVRRIGDEKWSLNTAVTPPKLQSSGEYPVQSKYVRLTNINESIKNGTLGTSIMPFGFGSYSYPFNAESTDVSIDIPLRLNQTGSDDSAYNSKIHMGVAFDSGSGQGAYKNDILPYLSPLPSSVTSTISSSRFNLSDLGFTTDTALAHKKFIMGFQKGNDGFDANYWGGTNGLFYGLGHAQPAGDDATSYKNAIDSVSNPDETDINMLVTPGINKKNHSAIYTKARDMVEDRQDTFYVFDTGDYDSSISDVIGSANGIQTEDTNYAATYHPWVKINDSDNNKQVWVPPSVVVPGVIAFTDKVAHPWFAPAGLNRGGLTEAVMAKERLTHADRDTLYENRVNPIATFPGEGVVIWGQKTLQAKPSALDRVNVRRLLISLKKFIASTSRYLVFEQNTNATRQKFLNIVNPYMEQVQSNSGLSAFRVVMDETNNTPDVVDRNQLKGSIFIQPTKTAEFIVLDFVVLPTGATFPE